MPVVDDGTIWSRYDPTEQELIIRERRFSFLVPGKLDETLFSDRFPLWARIWKASIILADCVAECPVDPTKHWLEIGAGVGLVGTVAAAFGHRVTITERDPDALEFVRANTVANGCRQASVAVMDWRRPETNEVFDYILGSELIYHPRHFNPLKSLFEKLLKPRGQVWLAFRMRRSVKAFFDQNHPAFDMRIQRFRLKACNEALPVYIARLKLR